jgi:flagellar hook-associated protein 2
MPAIQFGGLSSGLQTTQIIDALMGAERLGLTRLQNSHKLYDTQKTAYDKLGTMLKDLLARSKSFTQSGAGSGRSAVSSLSSAFTATAGATAITGQYRISVDRLATATKATSTGSVGTAVTDSTATGTLSSLPLAGSVTAGQVGIVVDGTIVHATIGDPTTTSLTDAMTAMTAAMQTQISGSDPGATVSASIVANRIEFAISGGSGTHSVRFGTGSDTSNALGIVGLAGLSSTTFASGAPISSTGVLGVVRATAALNAAGLTGLASTTTGSLQVNGVAIAYDTTVDSLNTILSRINASTAGVIASVDRANDRIVLTNKTAGSKVIDLVDASGTLGAALQLAPGTTNAQAIGQTAQVTVNDQVFTSDTNHVSNAIAGVTIDLFEQTVGTASLTVDVDRTKVKTAIKDFVTAFNALADLLDTQTALPPSKGAAAGPLNHEDGIRGMALGLRSTMLQAAAGFSGAISSFADLGVTSGAIGSAVGATKRLVFDEAKLDAALDADPTRVADLLSADGGVMKPLVDRLLSLTGTNGLLDSRLKGLASAVTSVTARERAYQDRMDLKQGMLERKFARLESTLALLQQQGSSIAAQTSSLNQNG